MSPNMEAWKASVRLEVAAEAQRIRRELDRVAPSQGQLRSSVVLYPGERVIPIPQVGGRRRPQVPARCSHQQRHEVQLSDGTTVAYICRLCDHNWADENYVSGMS